MSDIDSFNHSRREAGDRKGPQDGGTSVATGVDTLAPVIPIRRGQIRVTDLATVIPLLGDAVDKPGDGAA